MVKEEILEGLRVGLARGEPLRKTMMSFYNAGYKKEDIEEAARALISPQTQQPQQPTKKFPSTSPKKPKKIQEPKQKPIKPPQVQQPQPTPTTQTQQTQQPSQPQQQIQPSQTQQPQQYYQYPPLHQPPTNVVQRVSAYGEKPKPFGAVITFVLVFFLLVFIGILVAVFLFKDELSEFFNNLL